MNKINHGFKECNNLILAYKKERIMKLIEQNEKEIKNMKAVKRYVMKNMK